MKNTCKVQSERNSHLGEPETYIGGQGGEGNKMQRNFRQREKNGKDMWIYSTIV